MSHFASNAIPAALFLCGPFYYYVAAHWFGIAHPAWIIGGYLVLTTLALMPQRLGLLLRHMNTIDYLMVVFLLIVLFSITIHGFSEKKGGIYTLAVYMLLPYGVARLFTINEIGQFIKACLVLGLVALPISVAGLATLSPTDLAQDRIRNFFGVYYSNNEAGLVVGVCLVMCTISILLSEGKKNVGIACRAIVWAGLALSAWVLTFLSARGGLVAGICVSGLLVFLIKPVTVRTRALLLGVLVLSVIISASMLPGERKAFIGQLVTAPISKKIHPPATNQDLAKSSADIEKPPGNNFQLYSLREAESVDPLKQRPQLLLDGNSPAIRILEYREALDLIVKFPFFGVGAGNFGVYSPTAKLLSKNALCIEEKRGMYVCPQSPVFSGPHSTILHVFAELGFLGFVAYSALLLFSLKGLYMLAKYSASGKEKAYAWYLGGVWLFYLITDQFYGNYFTSFQFYLLTGCVAAAFLPIMTSSKEPPVRTC